MSTYEQRVCSCDECSAGDHAAKGELAPDGWRRTLSGALLCPMCFERHILRLRVKHGYPVEGLTS